MILEVPEIWMGQDFSKIALDMDNCLENTDQLYNDVITRSLVMKFKCESTKAAYQI